MVAVNVGNEALVDWNDHMVPLEQVIAYVRQVKAAIEQPVTVADNYVWWIREGAPLAAEVDFLGVHTYPAWEEKTIDEALAFTIENIDGVREALPDKPIAILEAGWATVASEFGERASEANQARYYDEMLELGDRDQHHGVLLRGLRRAVEGQSGQPAGRREALGPVQRRSDAQGSHALISQGFVARVTSSTRTRTQTADRSPRRRR